MRALSLAAVLALAACADSAPEPVTVEPVPAGSAAADSLRDLTAPGGTLQPDDGLAPTETLAPTDDMAPDTDLAPE